MKLRKKVISLFLFYFFFFFYSNAFAIPKGTMMNPITDVDWTGIFPIRIGGITVVSSDIPTASEETDIPTCKCGLLRVGIKVSFWEPARIEETVKDAFFFPSLGLSLGSSISPFLDGGTRKSIAGEGVSSSTKAQNHYFIFPVWKNLGLLKDFICLKGDGFDIGYISEVDPTHNNCLLSFILNPEAILFGNPVAALACVADSVIVNTATRTLPKVTNYLFWCVGSWGTVYPLCGTVSTDNQIEANALLASKAIFKLGRMGLLLDLGNNYCAPTPSLIWTKTNYRLQPVKPVRGRAMPLGGSSIIWGAGKNPPFGTGFSSSDNFAWMIFRHVKCCASPIPLP